jgi:succinate-semialdehyde dehydrogenase / glutarate-semialdehyde dehydrogenase
MPLARINPATGETEEEFLEHTPDEVQALLAHAEIGFAALKRLSIAERGTLMHAAADLMEADAHTVAPALVREMGKPLAQAQAEVAKCVRNMRYYADNSAAFLADEPLHDPSVVGATAAFARYEPLGIVLAVMPWNFPLWQVMRFAAPALMAGNAGLLKHASNVPFSADYLGSLFSRAGFPEGSFTTLKIPSGMVATVIDDPRVRAVTLTGSEPAGRAVAEQAGRQIKKVVLELGGSDAFIVMPSADIAQSASVGVKARMLNNGQSCIAAKRFIVHEDIYDRWLDAFVAEMESLVVGDPMQDGVDVGPLATRGGQRDISDLVEDAKSKGARVVVGGQLPPGAGFYYPPTVIDEITSDMRLMMEETFGPVASVYKVASATEAITIANQTTFGLSSALWSTDPIEHEVFMRELDAGAVFINGMTISFPELPFGGIKDSGHGRELGMHGIREFTNIKTIWKN